MMSRPEVAAIAEKCCLVCDSSLVEVAFEKHSIPYARCTNCGLLYSLAETNPNLENTLENFEPTYLEYFQDKATDQRHAAKMLEWIGQHTPIAERSLLDVGCGAGKFVRFLRSRSIEAYGLEPSAALFCEHLAKNEWFIGGTVKEHAQLGRRYSVITLFDVLEHVASPREFLNDIFDLLNEQGWLFISTPNLGSLSARLMGRHWHFINKYHLSLFSAGSVRLLLEPKFKIKQITSFGKSYPVSYLARYLGTFFFNRTWQITSNLSRFSIYLNTGEILYVAARKT
jgi:2-polyprenyl-3-methyl-5-hydroxy-6-metoxy-1,4-benzoquinol methylase